MHTLALRALLVTTALSALPARLRPAQEGVTVTFLANEGVLLSAGNKKVLIDALFQEYGPMYALPHDSTRRALQAARPPFDNVDLILATHHHGDHYHPEQVAAHMRANPRAVLVTSQQVIDSLRGRVPANDPLRARFRSRTTAPGAQSMEDVNGIKVHLLGLPHGGHPTVEHLGYIVELGGRRVLHVGDTDFSEQAFAPLRLDTMRIDVALLPYGFLIGQNPRRVVERWIRPRQAVGFHVEVGDGERAARGVQAAMPSAVTFYRSLETRRW
jgi:L-ascorbate metabolism protein UlaG (beta-lactamase superfamily)